MSRGLRFTVPALLAALWLAWTAVGGQTFGQLSEVVTNDQAAFLPEHAESTQALQLSKQFSDEQAVPATVIVALDDGGELAGEQLSEIEEAVAEIESLADVAQVVGPQPAEDGEAAQTLVLLDEDSVEDGGVDELRSVVDAAFGADWSAHVTGPAALSSDFSSAFAGIDGLLLAVAVAAVLIILVVVYRSLLLPVLVLLSAIGALCAAVTVIHQIAAAEWITLDGQSQGILSILVIGAATNYSLLLVARYREELGLRRSRYGALLTAVRRAAPPILASGSTVAIALLCLLFSDLNSNQALGPVAAIGIVFSMAATLTFLPALLALCGRPVFWPRVPAVQPGATRSGALVWERTAAVVRRRPRAVWVVVTLLLAVAAVGVTDLRAQGVAQSELVLGETEAKEGQALLEEHFDAGTGSPAEVFVSQDDGAEALEAVEDVDGVAEASFLAEDDAPAAGPQQAQSVDGVIQLSVTLEHPGDSKEAEETVGEIRAGLDQLDDRALVGGTSATQLDTNETAQQDLQTIIPIVLAVIGIILFVLLRSAVAAVLLVATTVLSYLSALGISAWVFNGVFEFPGADPSVPLFGFMFLVALGVDYNIFLMTRAREETPRRGPQEGLLRALVVTGGVITSAGVVLAATFTALAVLPLMFMVQIAFLVALGVFIDTFIVRTLQVPAAGVDLGRRLWWPSFRSLSSAPRAEARQPHR